MTALTYDLHIHSCLSPCASDDMTPANIVGMAQLKGLDVIAVTDHNSCLNSPAVLAAAQKCGILAIPGMELTTAEEIHVLCYFPSLTYAMEFNSYVSHQLLSFPNREDIFGKQQIYNEYDEICGTEERLLISRTEIPLDDLASITSRFHGIYIPAHIDKSSDSLLSSLGFVPPDSRFTAYELKNPTMEATLLVQNPYLRHCHMLHNSDAHELCDIKEPLESIRTDRTEIPAILTALSTKLQENPHRNKRGSFLSVKGHNYF